MKSCIIALGALLAGASACLAQDVNPPGFGSPIDGGTAGVNPAGFGNQLNPGVVPGGLNQPGFGDPFGLSNPGAFNRGAGAVGFGQGAFAGAPGFWGGSGGYVATGHPLAAELDWAAARSMMLRSRGEYWEDLSRARQNVTQSMRHWEQAREQYLENQDLWNDVYLEQLRIYRELEQQRAEERQRELQAYREAQELLRPEPLASGELNRETGEITWPEALQNAEFAEEREQLEHLLSARARSSGMGEGEIGRRVSVLVRLMELKLKDQLGEISQQQYTLASNFLDRLRYDTWVAER